MRTPRSLVGFTTVPPSASSWPSNSLNTVLLPAPLRPMTPQHSPSWMAHVTSFSTSWGPKWRSTWLREASMVGDSHLSAGRPPCGGLLFGGANRDRTDDLLHAMQALSQLSYGPNREDPVSHPLCASASTDHGAVRRSLWPAWMRSLFSRFQVLRSFGFTPYFRAIRARDSPFWTRWTEAVARLAEATGAPPGRRTSSPGCRAFAAAGFNRSNSPRDTLWARASFASVSPGLALTTRGDEGSAWAP